MKLTIQPFTVHKRVPLTISRGTHAASTNVWVRIEADGIEGWGEASPFSIGTHPQTTPAILADLARLQDGLSACHPFDRQAIDQKMAMAGVSTAVRAAIDVALWDWLGRSTGQPVWRLLGLDLTYLPPTSGTIGITTPEQAQTRLADWLQQYQLKAIKVKLGSPSGPEADRAMFEAICQVSPPDISFSVDANGGWSLNTALAMATWLAERRVTYLEQPLAPDQEQELKQLHQQSPLPIFLDESCFCSSDIPKLADRADGVNIKLMKSGGISEALRMIHTARACGLQIMFGCYSDSTISNTALAHLSPLADFLDLDSHLNLRDDPFSGAEIKAGYLIPNVNPGFGFTYGTFE